MDSPAASLNSTAESQSEEVNQLKEVTVDYNVNSPRFSVQNTEEIQQGIQHLNEYGYAVFSNLLTDNEVKHSIDLFWVFLENLRSPYHILRNDPQTWDKGWPGMPHIGLVNNYGIGQSEFMWFLRGNPYVKKVFSHIWNSNELCVSFDGAGCFRNWHFNKQWKTTSGWYHCDQNPFNKPNRCSIQGFVSLTDGDESTGGFVVVPESHKHFLELKSTTEPRRIWGDYIKAPIKHPIFRKLRPHLVKCKAGDLVVWDSRSIHCSTPAMVEKENTNQPELLRIVAYICMSPISMFTPDMDEYKNLDEFRQLREKYVRFRSTCAHWPLELISDGTVIRDDKKLLKLNEYQHSLIIGTHIEPENGTREIEF